jgi:predicted O-methyltransferase YrrM
MIRVEWPCSQKISELNLLQEFLINKPLKYVLEIGSFWGGTALLWAKLVESNDGKVYTIDLLHRPTAVYRNTPWEKYVTEIMGDSHSQEVKGKIWKRVPLEGFDMLFIDGDHSYWGGKQDFSFFSQTVKPGGVIVLHDILNTEYHRNIPPPDGPVEIYKLWEEIKDVYVSYELLDPSGDRTYMGIGVVEWPGTQIDLMIKNWPIEGE